MTGCLVGCLLTGPTCNMLVCAMTDCLVGCLLTGPTCTVLVCAMIACISLIVLTSLLLQHQALQVAHQGKYKLPSPKVTTFSIAEHGVYCLLIFEYCYFLLQNGKAPKKKDVIALAVKDYKSSGIKGTIHQAIKSAVQQHGHNLEDLCQTLVQIILENRLSHKTVI
ncbi:hypothetical protein BKA82DRAFT_4342769 [Pisolithus tinctorius]|nr:hypothetical protein BKA82DRAFT_4342769 [Pisolithus tinctorius]